MAEIRKVSCTRNMNCISHFGPSSRNTKIHRLGQFLNNRNLPLVVLNARKLKTKFLAESVPGKHPLAHPLTLTSHEREMRDLSGLSHNDTNLTSQRPLPSNAMSFRGEDVTI